MELKEALKYLEEISFYLELKGENVFKINAFNNAVRQLSQMNVELSRGLKDGTFEKTKGVGKAILSILQELNDKSESHVLIELREEFPSTIYELTKIHGLGPKKIKKLYDVLKISSIDELEQACIENKLITIPGFGDKSQNSILSNLEKIKKYKGNLLLHKAHLIARQIEEEILNDKFVKRYSLTGELRRSCEIISKIEFILVCEKNFIDKIAKRFQIDSKSKDRISAKQDDFRVDFHLSSKEDFARKLFQTTGPKNFVDKILAQIPSNKVFHAEEEIFNYVNHVFVQPQLRDNPGLQNRNYDFAKISDLKGLLHVHSNYSDGVNSIQEIIDYAGKSGIEYVLLCDHSKSAFYANGLNEERLKKQWEEIDSINKKSSRVKVLKGIECDILVDGTLDYPDSTLQKFDCVVVSVHSRFNLTKEEMTKRICRALENKYVKILGHLTGRLLLSRDEYQVDVKKVIDTASTFGKVIELNCDPHRLDLDWRWHQYAVSKGVKIAICPDAHSLKGIDNVVFGLEIAKKGGLEKKDIINTLNFDSFVKKYC
jgi:DNA polymerase (family 10)